MDNHLFFGFSYWKHEYMSKFFYELDSLVFINPWFKKNVFKCAVKKGLNPKSSIYIWGKKDFKEIEEYAKFHNINIIRVEDGFIRSVSLGSDLTTPFSQVVDKSGIYFDPNTPSDLENILNTYKFNQELLNRAKKVKEHLIDSKISKYNIFENVDLALPKDKKIVLVPGQVEDDASIKFGANGMSNLELLKKARENVKDGFIVFKPHPDVLVGNRVGLVDEKDALKYCDKIVTNVGLDSILAVCEEVHTMTSLVGFEALMYGKKVFTYGLPFYASWGLTSDQNSLARRDRILSVDELVAATLILYPRYYNPYKDKICEIEDILDLIESQRELYKSTIFKYKNKIRNYISRKIQLFLRILMLK